MIKNKISILIVEDSEDDQALIALELGMAEVDADLTFIQTSEELIKALQVQSFHIILCDYNLPSFDAISALKIVNDSELDIPFIIVSAHITEQKAIEAMRMGASDFVMKDNLAKLVLIIERELYEAETRTIKRLTEKYLRQTKASLQAIIDNSPSMFFLLDQQGIVTLSNKSFQCVFGEGKYNAQSNSNTITLKKSVEDLRERVIQIKQTVTEELVIPTLDSVFEISCFLIEGEEFESGYVGVSLTNITQRKRDQAQVAQLQKMEALGKLTGGVAHDFNNLLTIIQGNAELLETEVDKGLKKFIDAILRASHNGSELTRHLLSSARTEPVNLSNTKVNSLISSMLKLIGRTLGSGISISFAPSKNDWISYVDGSQLENVILNMLINARDSMEDEGEIFIKTTNEKIAIAPRNAIMPAPPGDYIHIAIKDTGSGIPDDVLASVFEPFFTTKDIDKGTGLGLTLIFSFIQRSKGFITVESEGGKGTTFGLYLPRTEEDVEKDVPPREALKIKRSKARILIVEDDADVLEVLVGVLCRVGHDITSASIGKDAIKILEGEKKFDLIISDVVLPGGMNGQEIMKKAIELQPSAKNLFISGHTKNLDLSAEEMGREISLLAKPFPMTKFIEKVDSLLGGL